MLIVYFTNDTTPFKSPEWPKMLLPSRLSAATFFVQVPAGFLTAPNSAVKPLIGMN